MANGGARVREERRGGEWPVREEEMARGRAGVEERPVREDAGARGRACVVGRFFLTAEQG